MHEMIAKTVAAVIAAKKDVVDYARRNRGGYEGWLQVEVAKKFDDMDVAVLREEPYLNSPQNYCDLVVNGVSVELKTESDGFNGYQGYGTPDDLRNDVHKLSALLNRGAYGYAVRISKDRANLPVGINGVADGAVVYRVNDYNPEMDQMNNLDWAVTSCGQSGHERGRYFITVVGVCGTAN